jgi:hypothetical protein
MIDMALRILTRAALSPVYGVNAQIALASSYGWLAAGDDPPPLFDTGAIADETSDDAVAWGSFPEGDPALALGQVAEWQLQGEIMTVHGSRDALQVPILWRYQHDDVDTRHATRDWYYTARALTKTLRVLMDSAHMTDQVLGNVHVYAMENFRILGPFQPREDVRIAGGLMTTIDVRDLAP